MNKDQGREIGARLKEFRVSMGLTQQAMASRLKVQRQSVSAWENGTALPGRDYWMALGKMGMSLDYVVLGIRTVPVSSFARTLALPVRVASPDPLPASG